MQIVGRGSFSPIFSAEAYKQTSIFKRPSALSRGYGGNVFEALLKLCLRLLALGSRAPPLPTPVSVLFTSRVARAVFSKA